MQTDFQTMDKETERIQTDKSTRLKIFENWLEEIHKILEIIQFRKNFSQEKLFDFYQSFMDGLEGKDSYKHFQLIDEAIPHFIRNNINRENATLAISKLRDLLIQNILKKIETEPQSIQNKIGFILEKFDELQTFINKNYELHLQILAKKNDSALNKTFPDVPAGIFQIIGQRLEGHSKVNQFISKICGFPEKKFSEAGFWKNLIHPRDLEKIKNTLNQIYQGRKNKYSIQYSLRFRNGEYYNVFEEGIIQYDAIGSPIKIDGYIIPLPNSRKLKKKLAYEQKKSGLLQHLSFTSQTICDHTGRILTCNNQFAQLLGVKIEQIIGSHFFDWVAHPSNGDVASFKDFIQKIRKKEIDKFFLKRTPHKNISVQFRFGELESLNGNIRYVFSLKEEKILPEESTIFEKFKRRLELLVKLQKELLLDHSNPNILNRILQYCIELIPDADAGSVLKIEKDGLHFVAAQGYDLDQLKKVTLFKNKPEKYQEYSSQIQMLMKGAQICEIPKIRNEAVKILNTQEYEILKKYGKIDSIQFTLSGVIQVDNKPYALLNIDSYDQKKKFTEEDKYIFDIYLQQINLLIKNQFLLQLIQNSEKNYRNFFEHSPTAAFIEQENQLKLVNPKLSELTGYSESELLDVSFRDLVHVNDLNKIQHIFKQKSININKVFKKEFKLLSKDGKETECVGFFSYISYKGKPALLGQISDTGRIKSLENQLFYAQKMDTLGTLTA